jgi:hypothetical protein
VLKLVSDEYFDGAILRGLYRRRRDLDVVRVQDIGLNATPDPDILAWAAIEGRILMPIGQAIDEILLAIDCLTPDECKDFVRFFPL